MSLGIWVNINHDVETLYSRGFRPDCELREGLNTVYFDIREKLLIPNQEFQFVLGASITNSYIVNPADCSIFLTTKIADDNNYFSIKSE